MGHEILAESKMDYTYNWRLYTGKFVKHIYIYFYCGSVDNSITECMHAHKHIVHLRTHSYSAVHTLHTNVGNNTH